VSAIWKFLFLFPVTADGGSAKVGAGQLFLLDVERARIEFGRYGVGEMPCRLVSKRSEVSH
jgi:hypothetical protein